MIKQIYMCEFVDNNWDIETCKVYIICMNSYNQVLTKRLNKFVCLWPTPIVTNDDINWYVVTCIVEDWTIRMYDFVKRKSWPCLCKFIQPCCWISIAHVWMRQMETVWCEFYPTKMNYDKEVPQKKIARGKSHLPRYIFSSKYRNFGKSVRVTPCHILLISVSDKERIVNNDWK